MPETGKNTSLAVHASGDGPTVVLIHGIPGSRHAWIDVEPRLLEAGYRVITLDLLGFGDSDRPSDRESLWIEAQVDAIAAALQARNESAAVIVGHDYGAPIAVRFAIRYPERSRALVLAAGNLFTDTPIPAPLKVVALPVVGDLAARVMFSAPALRMMLWAGSGRPRPTLNHESYIGDPEQQLAIRTIFTTALRELAGRYAQIEAALSRLHLPVSVIWGDRDPFFSVEIGRRAARSISGARFHLARGAGHFLPAERADLFVEAVRHVASPVSSAIDMNRSRFSSIL